MFLSQALNEFTDDPNRSRSGFLGNGFLFRLVRCAEYVVPDRTAYSESTAGVPEMVKNVVVLDRKPEP